MRIGSGLLSFVLHAGFAFAGLLAAPYLVNEESTKMMIIPLDLEMADTTNLKPISESVREEEIDAPQPKVESFASSAPPPPAADEILPDETKPEAKKDEPKKADAAPTPPKPQEKPKTALQEMNEALANVPRDVSNPRATPGPKPSFENVTDPGAPRDGVGKRNKDSATMADQIMSQLLARRCWTDQDDMADSRRLSAVIEVQFARPGKLSKMTLISPSPQPSNDRIMLVFIQRAFDALNKCNVQGYQVPDAYFTRPFPIQIEFRP